MVWISPSDTLRLQRGWKKQPGGRSKSWRRIAALDAIPAGAWMLPNPASDANDVIRTALLHARDFSNKTVPAVIPEKLSGLSVEEQLDFCGGCHRTWQEVSSSGPHDINNVRFQPYRLATSRCYNSSVNDRRISCVACHDPHLEVVKGAVYYDAKCGACHEPRNVSSSAKICPVAQHGCINCHMPKIDFPHGHFKFTDHRIRVVRSAAGYPG